MTLHRVMVEVYVEADDPQAAWWKVARWIDDVKDAPDRRPWTHGVSVKSAEEVR